MLNTNLFLKLTRNESSSGLIRNRPRVICADGFQISIQASRCHYCDPRNNNADKYDKVELGYPSEEENLIMRYAEEDEEPTHTVYGYVPVEIVDEMLKKHGGIVDVCRRELGE